MPRDSNGIYTLPAGNPVQSGTLIQSDWANTTMTDIAVALTNSLPRNGSAPMNGALAMASGNLQFTGVGQRITGDFSNALRANRVLFQSSTLNGATNVGAIPNGTSQNGQFTAYSSADPDNSSFIGLASDTTSGISTILSSKSGTGTYLPMTFQTGGVERFRLSATANLFQADFSNATPSNRLSFQSSTANGGSVVGILPNGTASSAHLRCYGNSDPTNASYIAIRSNGTTDMQIESNREGSGSYVPLLFATSGSERYRITTAGEIAVGTSGLTNCRQSIFYTRASEYGLIIKPSADSGAGTAILFQNAAGTVIGSISTNSTNTSFNTSSDYRLKDDIKDLVGSGAFIDALRPRSFTWKSTGESAYGFIAHEFQQVAPGSVTGSKDATKKEKVKDEQGNDTTVEIDVPDYQAMFPGSPEVIAMMVAELQSLRKRVAALEGA